MRLKCQESSIPGSQEMLFYVGHGRLGRGLLAVWMRLPGKPLSASQAEREGLEAESQSCLGDGRTKTQLVPSTDRLR